ncbi:MAG: aminodeoxychorismate/anthranilate synthase component II, partial [Bacteroidetes bacterium]|nr:aminodeoxychorismate/anthranilate synthase component II [Bacteroidota bacterium]
FGSKLKNLDTVFHGIATNIYLTKSSTHLFNEIEMPMQVGRYHSWVIDENTLSKDLQITSVDKDRNIMSIKHKQFDIESVQFHPESIMTTSGEMLLRNWIKQ